MKIAEKMLERYYKALANRRRLMILRVLKAKKRASVGEIASAIGLSFKATSKHLGILYSVGFLEKEQESLTVFYSLPSDLPRPAADTLTYL